MSMKIKEWKIKKNKTPNILSILNILSFYLEICELLN